MTSRNRQSAASRTFYEVYAPGLACPQGMVYETWEEAVAVAREAFERQIVAGPADVGVTIEPTEMTEEEYRTLEMYDDPIADAVVDAS